MHLSSDVQIPDGLLAANALLAENSRQGFETYSGTLHQGFGFVISHTSLGITGPLYDGDVRSRCTGKERDTESGLDYFPARMYGSSMGRFMSPDPSGLYMADPANPQQLNLYAYVGNNPLRFTDPLGLSSDCGGGGDPSVVCMVTTAWDWLKSHLGGGGDSGNNPSSPGGGGGGQGPEPPDQSPPVSPLVFPGTPAGRDAAGIAASRQALVSTSQPDRSNPACSGGCKYEWGGRILKNRSGQYTFTQPVTFKNSTTFWTSHVMVPFGYRKAGSYHTHPGFGAPGMSGNPGDAGWADSQHLPEYMGEEMSGKVWKYAGDGSCSAEPCGSVISDPNHP
jgi:RHS repeat-associated protein